MKQGICFILSFMLILMLCIGLAEQKQYGDYIYVPASGSDAGTGIIHLAVNGIGYDPETGEAQQIENLKGAEFGVYVISAGGEVRPWANPLFPTEQMKIRTGADGASFTLPFGMDYYLMQESSQNGYLFDAEALIKVDSDELKVENYMPAMVAVQVMDSLQYPVNGLFLQLTDEDGNVSEIETDDNGWAKFTSNTAIRGQVTEASLPDGVYPAKSGTVNGIESSIPVTVDCEPGNCVTVRFEHPAMGYVQLNAALAVLDDMGEIVTSPLAGIIMRIDAETERVLTTDDEGFAEISLLEGTYPVTFSTDDDAIHLPFDHASLVIESGGVTTVPVEAVLDEGRIIVEAAFGGHDAEGMVRISDSEGKETLFETGIGAVGHVVSPALPSGIYSVQLDPGSKNRIAELYCEQMTEQRDDIALIEVLPGSVSRLEAEISVPESQQYAVTVQTINESGDIALEAVTVSGTATLMNDGKEQIPVEIEDGNLFVETFSGEYWLELDADLAETIGVRRTSERFSLPSDDGTVVFPVTGGRALLRVSDSKGEPAAAGVYRIKDADGNVHTLSTDEGGLAISPMLAEGTAEIENIELPVNCDECPIMQVQISAGKLEQVEVVHPRRGTVTITVVRQQVENGALTKVPVEEMGVQLTAVTGFVDDGMEYRDTDANGTVRMTLQAGSYEASLAADEIDASERAGEPATFTIENNQDLEVQLTLYAAEGGIEVCLQNQETLAPQLLTQVQFVLENEQGSTLLQLKDGVFAADGFAAGTYTLSETQAPTGYSLMKPREVQITGGEIAAVQVPLEEYATVTVTKYGLTFDDSLKNYLVPLSGGYGVYLVEDGAEVPYPDADSQMVVYSNVSAESGLPSSVQLPAEDAGTVYRLKELEANIGFALDTETHEILAYPGQTYDLTCSVSSDRGFYHLTLRDHDDGTLVSGAKFTLSDAAGETISTFELNEDYRNDMAIPVGDYTLTQTEAAPGYMLTESVKSFRVEPYLTMGGQVSEVAYTTQRIPEADWGEALINGFTSSQELGMTLVTVDPAPYPETMALEVPQITLRLLPKDGGAATIRSISLNGIQEGIGDAGMRIEYMVENAGWQSGSSQMVTGSDMPKTVILPETELVTAVRVTYLDMSTGLEHCDAGFVPGDISLQVCGYGNEPTETEVEASVTGTVKYSTGIDLPEETCRISSSAYASVTAEPAGMTVPAAMGRDGRISGCVFYDEGIDGIIMPDSARLGGIAVTLCDTSSNAIDTVQTDEEGRFAFTSLSAGTYVLEFESEYIYTRGELYTPFLTSRVSTTGVSDLITVDSEHTDEWIMAGCVTPATITGTLTEQVSPEETAPVEGCLVELWKIGQDEPVIVVTDAYGAYAASNLLPGDYEIRVNLPDGSLSQDAVDGYLSADVTLGEGELKQTDEIQLIRAAHLSGCVRVDDNGDGQIAETAQGVSSIRVELARLLPDGHAETVDTAETDAEGRYAFDGIYPGDYTLSYTLGDNWVFTRYGVDSDVFGSVSGTGSTKPFSLVCGETAEKNAGVTMPSELSVMVFRDQRMDGIRQANEEGIEGVVISLVRVESGEDAEVLTAFTDQTGLVTFSRVSPGEYRLAYRMPGIWRATVEGYPDGSQAYSFVPQTTESEGRSSVFAIPMGTALNLYIGAVQTGNIGGQVFYDDNADAAMGTGEAPAAGIPVVLLNAQDIQIAETVTEADGTYIFTGLPTGRYKVRFTANVGECFSGNERTAVRNAAERSDSNVSSTRLITLEGGRSVTGANAGIVRLSYITGQVFIDRNADSNWGQDESGMQDVEVALTSESGRVVVATVRSDADGNFAFYNVYPGQYKLRIDAGEYYVYAGNTPGNTLPVESHTGNWYYSAQFTVMGNTEAAGMCYGFLQQSLIRGTVWEDTNYNGSMDGESGLRYVQVTLYDETGTECANARTDRDGKFEFSKLMPGTYSLQIALESGYVFTVNGPESMTPRLNSNVCSVSLDYLDMGEVRDNIKIGALKPGSLTGYAWYDADSDGRRQTDSQPMANIPVTMNVIAGSDAGLEITVATDADGRYRFDGVMPGTVTIRAVLPESCAFTKNANGLKRVSIIPETDDYDAVSGSISMEAGMNLTDLDIGIVGIGGISGNTWLDKVYDGVQTAEDEPLAGVRVELVDNVSGQMVKSTESNEFGAYAIDRVRTGEYRVRFVLPDGMVFTMSGAGTVEMSDERSAETEPIQLQMGEQRSGVSAGAILPATISGTMLDEDMNDGFGHVMVSLMEGGMAV
ncbi:MAG: hypothetical protein IJT77_12705, partial [Clostridia bacterium]|nr:hypothetical protein [Clostridia bacterium]